MQTGESEEKETDISLLFPALQASPYHAPLPHHDAGSLPRLSLSYVTSLSHPRRSGPLSFPVALGDPPWAPARILDLLPILPLPPIPASCPAPLECIVPSPLPVGLYFEASSWMHVGPVCILVS